MLSKDYQDFISSCFPKSYGEAHNGLNIHALFNLKGNELAEAEKIILERIKDKGGNAIDAAGYLQLQSAKRLLEDEFVKLIQVHDKYSTRIVKVAWALYQIEKYDKSLDVIIEFLEDIKEDNKFPFLGLETFSYLISFGDDPMAISYLEKCLDVEKYDYYAMCALVSIERGNRLPFFEDNFFLISDLAKKRLAEYKERY